MAMFKDILETVRMIEKERLDIRTITMGISLLDCIDSSGKKSRQKIYDKITHLAENLVKEGERIENELGLPIVNKRISVTPISLIAGSSADLNYVEYAKILDAAAATVGVNFIGGFSALVPKGFTTGDRILIDSIPEALATTNFVCSSVNLATTKAGINMDAVKRLGEVIKETAYLTRDADSIGCAKFVAFANAVEDNPFMAGAFHGVGEGEAVLNVGVSGPGVVKRALEKAQDASFGEMAEIIKKTAFKITRAGHLVGTTVAKRLNVPFGILDLSLAPTPEIGDSVARILEEMGLEHCGTHGTTAALAMLNDAVKKGGIMASTSVGGFSGAFIPVSEDEGMIEAVQCGALTFDKLEAMTSVCSVGIDMVAIPGDTPATTISAILADEAAIGVINNKTTGVRLIPVHGKVVGDMAEFGGLLGRAPIMAVNQYDSSVFINRGGQIPAPIHSFKN
ncbi:MAG: PFL family protein [Eubacteriaceae bacterium]|nr:PFL family protein [Eubacteriaceae bacterium]